MATTQETITGTVTDGQSGETLPGVNILVKGTSTGTSTDSEGNFELTVESLQDTLVVSFVGYQTQDVPINGRTDISIEMQSQAITGEEMVVVGYGTQRKSDLTGSVSSVGESDLDKSGNTSVGQTMQGKIPGVSIRQSTAEPGGALSVRIRGAGSITAGTQPLYVIDGIPLSSGSLTGSGESGSRLQNRSSPLNALNPNDIESIDVLKGPSATAIYGSRGSNGVVLITTKQGTSGSTNVSYSSYLGIQSATKHINLLNAQEYMTGLNQLSVKQGDGPIFSSEEMNDIGGGMDWQDYVIRDSPIQEHNLSVSGGSDNSSYFTSFNYLNNRGIVENSGLKRYTVRGNVEQTLKDKLTIGLRFNFSQEQQDRSLENLQENEDSGPVNTALGYDPTLPVTESNGEYPQPEFLTLTHPGRILNGMENEGQKAVIFGNVKGEYDITNSLSANINLGGDRRMVRGDFYQNNLTRAGDAQNGIASVNSVERTHLVSEFTLSYSKDLNANNSLDAVGGVTYENNVDRSLFSGTSGFPTDNFLTNNLGAGDPTQNGVNSNKIEYSLLSYLGRVNYSLKDKYLFTISYRIDGSSRFGENNKYSQFPSLALGWNLSEEPFIPNSFSQLKLRTSWGISGNQEIGNYNSLATFSPSSVWLGDQSQNAIHPARKPNPDLKWEESTQWNFGLDYGFLDQRITGTLEYYIKKTENLLLNFPLPISSGYSSILRNVGSMKNTGVEFSIDSRNITKQNFSWRTTLNFSRNINEVTNLGGVDQINMGNLKLAGNTTITKVGLPLNSYYGYQVNGFFQNEQEVSNSAQPNAEPGFPRFEDTNGDGQITSSDRQVLGNQYPDFTLGFRNAFNYKNWSLNFFLQGEIGADLLNLNILQGMFPANFRRNRYAPLITDQWTPENQDANWPTAVNTNRYSYGRVNSLIIEDATYLRLQSLELGYQFPNIGANILESARIYVKGKNVLTLTDFSGYNPEGNVFGGNSNARIAWNSYPMARTWMAGVEIAF